MELETTSNGFVLKLDGEDGPAIEWMASSDEVIILLPPRTPEGRPGPDAKSYVVRVKRHARISPSVSIHPVELG